MPSEHCFIYCRQSSGQDDSDNSVSIQQQIQNCMDCAARQQWEVLDVFTDANVSGKTYPAGAKFERIAESDQGFQTWFAGQSSRKKFRSGLGDMLARLNEVSYVIVDEITRLHRSASRSFLEQTINYEFSTAHVRIFQVKGGVIDLSKFDQNLIQMLRTQINDEQISNQKKKSMESRRRIKDDGVLSNVHFFGGVYDGNKRFHFDRAKADLIRKLFTRVGEGVPLRELVYRVNRNYSQLIAPAKFFYGSTLRSILSNPVYAGYMRNSDGDLIACRNAPPPIVTLEEYEAVRKLVFAKRELRQKSHTVAGTKRPLPFTGYLKCAECGGNLIVNVDKGKVFYKCRRADTSRDAKCRRCRVLVNYDGDFRKPGGLFHAIRPLLAIAFRIRYRRCGELETIMLHRREIEQDVAKLRKKLKVAFELFCEDGCDEETYSDVTRSALTRLRRGKSELYDILVHSNVSHTEEKERIVAEYRDFLEKNETMTPNDIAGLLADAVRKIEVGPESLRVETGLGSFVLPRYAKDLKQRNILPFGKIEKLENANKNKHFSGISPCRVVYDYRPSGDRLPPRQSTLAQLDDIAICALESCETGKEEV